MLFEVIKDKKIVARTDQIRCIYDEAQLKDIQSAGFTFRLNGKEVTIKAIKTFCNKNKELRKNGSECFN